LSSGEYRHRPPPATVTLLPWPFVVYLSTFLFMDKIWHNGS